MRGFSGKILGVGGQKGLEKAWFVVWGLFVCFRFAVAKHGDFRSPFYEDTINVDGCLCGCLNVPYLTVFCP
jgi:hypothetical protein